jgi:hypothetical protein
MQNYSNHRRFYPLHHFILTPISLVLLIWSLRVLLQNAGFTSQNVFNFFIALALLLCVLIARLYALKNQNRLIRIEMRYRFFELTGKSFAEKEAKLRLSQLIALRFASDSELVPLINKSISENLSSKQIKLAIKNWLPDHHRV